MFVDGEPLVGGDSVPVVVEPLVNGELSDRNTKLDPREEASLEDFQEVNLDEFLDDGIVEKLSSKLGFKHESGCNEIIFDKKTIAKKMVKETSIGTALVVLGGLTGYKQAATAISYIVGSANVREEAVVGWSDNIEMVDGIPTCSCGKEVKIK